MCTILNLCFGFRQNNIHQKEISLQVNIQPAKTSSLTCWARMRGYHENSKKIFPRGKNGVQEFFKIFEAILPLFDGNMLYFFISGSSRVCRSII